MARLETRPSRALFVAAVASSGLAVGCVEPFSGSHMTIDFSESVPLPARRGTTPTGVQPPADTYFTLYAVDNAYDSDGNVTQSFLFDVQDFELKPLIDLTSPCYIELPSRDEPNFPGLHVSMFLDAVKAKTGIDDPFDPPNGASEGDITDVLDAQVRMANLPDLAADVKAVTSKSTFEYPAAIADCNFSGDEIPAPSCMDEASNAQRLRVCQQLWSEHPEFYEGSDRVFTTPLAGKVFGFVEGTNPINNGFLGGSSLFVDEVLDSFDALTITWKYKDDAMNVDPQGTTFLSGTPEHRVRGVINTHLSSTRSAQVFAEIAIFPDLGEDDVHF
ncbi:MAG: hypothetical protein H6709_06320 [Kofleriaceae bacterium]|nr:hypothetical protein [Kofleriaceae bacterium]MCB9571690.1 hypothetical protein [Kofleriaceae bacterium]